MTLHLNEMKPAAGAKRPRLRVGRGASVGDADTVALADAVGVAEEIGVALVDVDGDAVIVGVGEAFRFLRGFGVGVGLTKSFFNLSPNVSSCSCVPRTSATLIAVVIAITKRKRSFLFTRHCIVQPPNSSNTV